MGRWILVLIGVLVLAAFLTCGCLGSVILIDSAIPALSRWAAPYGIEGRKPPSESVNIENVLPRQVEEYDLTEVVEPLPPMTLDIVAPSKQGNYSDGAQIVHLIAAQMEGIKEVQSLVAQVDEEVNKAGAVSLNGRWLAPANLSGAWKMSRLTWDKWYVRFCIPSWDDQACGVAWNNGSWFFMVTGDSKRALERFVPHFDY